VAFTKGLRVEGELLRLVDALPREVSRCFPRRDTSSAIVNDQPASAKESPARPVNPSRDRQRAAARLRFWPSLATAARFFILTLIGALAIVIAREWDWRVGSVLQQTTDGAYLQVDLTPLSASVPGYVGTLRMRDLREVSAGALLVEIVDDNYRAQLELAQANAAAAQAAIERVER